MKAGSSTISVDRNSHVPIHRQVEAYLRKRIEAGDFAPARRLPSEKALCRQFGGISHLTVRQAIKSLASDRLVKSVPGRGLFVAQKESRLRRVSLVLPNLEDEWTLRIARGVHRVFDAAGVKALIMDSRSDSEKEADSIHHLEDLPLDGAIIFPLPYSDIAEQILKLKLDKFPVVLIDRELQDIQVPAVVVDNYRGSYELTTHLIKKGYKRMAWVGELNVSTTRARLEGFRDALSDHRVFYERALTKKIELPTPTSSTSKEVIRRIVRELMDLSCRPDAIVFVNDLGALTGMDELRQLGLRIPQDVAVAGFDDIAEAARSTPPLTTVRQPTEQIGEEAAKLSLQLIEQQDGPASRVVLPVEVVVRESC